MKPNHKKILQVLLFPHIAVIILLFILSAILLTAAFAFSSSSDAVNYISYVLSAYTLTVICLRIPRMVKKANSIKESNKYLRLYSSDAHFRIKLSLFASVLFNGAYASFQLVLGISESSVWFYSLSGYYFLLVLMRIFLLNHTVKFKPGEKIFREQLIYRLCGICILLMTAALTVIIIYVATQSRARSQNEIITIAMAAFTFTSMTVAVVNVIKYRKYDSPVWSASKALGFVAALVSMLTLEDAMLASFGEQEGEAFRRTMASLTGAAISAVVIAIAAFMMIHSTKSIKRYKDTNGAGNEQR